MDDVVRDQLCFTLSARAERARWRMDDIAWDRIDPARAPEPLRVLVKDIAFAELTTSTATRRFLEDLGDDTDFTQWISVWFFEETRHPQVLLRWLSELGVAVDHQFMRRGRATAPLMKSRFGTLITNVISELVASASYANLAARSEEPVLATIAKHLSADEARHAAGFTAYARRYLERSSEPDADRRDAIKVLYLWFQDHANVRHPVSELFARSGDARGTLGSDDRELRARVFGVIGSIIDLALTPESDLLVHVRDLGMQEGRAG
jgi:tRNA isopentenyl-2-thiomethyl-A-37 hydroxylase MiaE